MWLRPFAGQTRTVAPPFDERFRLDLVLLTARLCRNNLPVSDVRRGKESIGRIRCLGTVDVGKAVVGVVRLRPLARGCDLFGSLATLAPPVDKRCRLDLLLMTPCLRQCAVRVSDVRRGRSRGSGNRVRSVGPVSGTMTGTGFV